MPGETHGGEHGLRRDVLAAGALIQQSQRVAHAAVGQAREQRRRVRLQVNLLLPGDVA